MALNLAIGWNVGLENDALESVAKKTPERRPTVGFPVSLEPCGSLNHPNLDVRGFRVDLYEATTALPFRATLPVVAALKAAAVAAPIK